MPACGEEEGTQPGESSRLCFPYAAGWGLAKFTIRVPPVQQLIGRLGPRLEVQQVAQRDVEDHERDGDRDEPDQPEDPERRR